MDIRNHVRGSRVSGQCLWITHLEITSLWIMSLIISRDHISLDCVSGLWISGSCLWVTHLRVTSLWIVPGPYLGITSLGIASSQSYYIFIEIADIGYYKPVYDSVDNYLELDISSKVLGLYHNL